MMTSTETASVVPSAGIKADFDCRDTRILIADDEPVTLRLLSHYLESSGFQVVTASDGKDAYEKMTPDVEVALLDVNMPRMSGLDCLRKLRGQFPDTEVIMVSGVGEIGDAVTAMKEGACEYVTKPFEREELLGHVLHAVRTARLSRDNRELRKVVGSPALLTQQAAFSESAKVLYQQAARLGELDSTVLLGGESGTGKTTIARMIHQIGPRADKPFVVVNCASLPRDLIEAELFGHTKGAFTGATDDRPGRAEVADGGTLFLDEVGDLPLELQPKLLTFLQDRTFQRIGSNKEIRVDVRVITATHQDLALMCEEKRFRPDLFFRLNVLNLAVPPLRQRVEDIPELATGVLRRIGARRSCEPLQIDDQATALLQRHHWPGNIRELENVLERASAFCMGPVITPEDLSLDGVSNPSPPDEPAKPASLAGLTLAEVEQRAILETLEACSGNKALAARELGISEKSIYNKMKRHGIFEKKSD
jgi:DNA-binding NtrC family response regulator